MKSTPDIAGCSDLVARLAVIGWGEAGVTAMSWNPGQPGKGVLERLVR